MWNLFLTSDVKSFPNFWYEIFTKFFSCSSLTCKLTFQLPVLPLIWYACLVFLCQPKLWCDKTECQHGFRVGQDSVELGQHCHICVDSDCPSHTYQQRLQLNSENSQRAISFLFMYKSIWIISNFLFVFWKLWTFWIVLQKFFCEGKKNKLNILMAWQQEFLPFFKHIDVLC